MVASVFEFVGVSALNIDWHAQCKLCLHFFNKVADTLVYSGQAVMFVVGATTGASGSRRAGPGFSSAVTFMAGLLVTMPALHSSSLSSGPGSSALGRYGQEGQFSGLRSSSTTAGYAHGWFCW